MNDYQDALPIAALLAAVDEPTRMQILYLLTDGPRHVGELAELLRIPLANTSHHLGVLRRAGVLDNRRDGKRIIYQFRSEVYSPGGSGPDVVGTLTVGRYRLSIIRTDDAVTSKAKAGE